MLCTTVYTVSISYGHKIRERCKERVQNTHSIYTQSLIRLLWVLINNAENIWGLMYKEIVCQSRNCHTSYLQIAWNRLYYKGGRDTHKNVT